MVTDELGERDDNEVPAGLNLPLKVDKFNEALVGSDGVVLSRHAFTSDSAEVVFARRRMEFVARLANGEVMVDRGKVLVKVAEQWQGDRLVVTFVDQAGQGSGAIPPVVIEESMTSDGDGLDFSLFSATERKKYKSLSQRLARLIGKAKARNENKDVPGD